MEAVVPEQERKDVGPADRPTPEKFIEQPFRAVVCQPDGSTSLEQKSMRPPAGGEILLKLKAVGLCGTDLFKLATNSADPGTVLGHELVGTVLALGDDVTKFKIGDRVVVPHHVSCGSCLYCRRGSETMCETFKENLMSPGGFADLVLIRRRAAENAAFVIPDNIADEKAVFTEPAACVLRGINRANLGPQDTTVILGSGSMGLLHLLVLKAVYPQISVLVVDPNSARRDIAASLGATMVSPPGGEARNCVDTLTGRLGADGVFDTVGGNATLQAGISLSRSGGAVILFAHAPENAIAGFDLNAFFKHERQIIGTYSGALAEQQEVFRLICNGMLDPSPLVTHTMPLNDFGRGVDLVVAQKALKVLFTPSVAEAN